MHRLDFQRYYLPGYSRHFAVGTPLGTAHMYYRVGRYMSPEEGEESQEEEEEEDVFMPHHRVRLLSSTFQRWFPKDICERCVGPIELINVTVS